MLAFNIVYNDLHNIHERLKRTKLNVQIGKHRSHHRNTVSFFPAKQPSRGVFNANEWSSNLT